MESINLAGGRFVRFKPHMPLVMGILNCTPDSFSDGAQRSVDEQVCRARQMVADGADIIDIGGESTRPGSCDVSADEEISRIVPVLLAFREADKKTIVSVDTKKSVVAGAALNAGADIINDVSGLVADPVMLQVAVEHEAPLILMHMQGNPENMQQQPQYDDVVAEVGAFLLGQAKKCEDAGVGRHKIVLDPGFGFGKTFAHNARLMRELETFRSYGYPLLVGVSRKSMIGAALDLPVDQRLEGSLALALMAADRGADILRVHDIKETARVLNMRRAILEG